MPLGDPSTLPDTPDLEDRLRFLESHVEVQEQIITAMQAERIEAERLSDSVQRLGVGADALGAALLQVDKNQQALTKLGQQLSDVEEAQVPRAEVDAKAAEVLKAARRRTFVIVGAVGAVILAILVVVAVQLDRRGDQRQYETCLRNQGVSVGVREFLTTVGENSQVPEIKQKANDLVEAFGPPKECVEP